MAGLQIGWSGRVSLKRTLKDEKEQGEEGTEAAEGPGRKQRAAEYVVPGAQDEAGQDGGLDKSLALISASRLLCRLNFCQSGSFSFRVGQAH